MPMGRWTGMSSGVMGDVRRARPTRTIVLATALAAALLLAWRAVTQDAPRKPEGRAIALGKTALTDNSAGLIRMARREHKMGWGYAQLIATLIAERIGAGRGDASQTVASLDRFGANHGITGAYSDLAAEASAAENTAQIVQAARKLHAWREDAIRATD